MAEGDERDLGRISAQEQGRGDADFLATITTSLRRHLSPSQIGIAHQAAPNRFERIGSGGSM